MNTTLQSRPRPLIDRSTATQPFPTAKTPSPEPVTPAPRLLGIRRILVPLDFSAMSLKSLQYAVAFAKQFGAALTLVHIVEIPLYADAPYAGLLGQEELAEVKKELEKICATRIPPELATEIVVRQNAAFAGILEVARESSADLIITTTHGRTGLKHLFLGSTAEDLVRRAPCPVLVVREREHDFV